MLIIRRFDCVPQPIVVCLVVAVVMLESRATFSTQYTRLATRLSSITTATTGQTTIGSGTQSDLLMMSIMVPETF